MRQEVTTDTMSRAYSEWPATSIVTRRTAFLVATGHAVDAVYFAWLGQVPVATAGLHPLIRSLHFTN